MAINIFVTETTSIIHLLNAGTGAVLIPRILPDLKFYYRVSHVSVDTMGFLIAYRVFHAIFGCSARHTHVRMLSGAALFLAVTTAVMDVKQVSDMAVQKRVNLLHSALHTVIMEIRPRHTLGS